MKKFIALVLAPLAFCAAAFGEGVVASASPAQPSQFSGYWAAHRAYVQNYWHEASAPLPPKRTFTLGRFTDAVPPTTPSDVYVLGAFGTSNWSYGVTNNYDVGACVERELHDGQWLAGGCKDVLYLLHADAAGNLSKFAHLGGGVMSNAQHANTTYQLRAGVDATTLGSTLGGAINLAAPNLNLNVPPFVSHLGQAITFDFTAGYRPTHDASVNGNFTYGLEAMVNVPITTTFEWLISGL